MDQRAHFIQIVFHERKRYQVYLLAGCKWAEPGPAATIRLERLRQRQDSVFGTGALTM